MTEEIIRTTICIIGAGPAGATTSLFLSKMHIPHTIVDSAVFPRDKVCGDGLDLKVLRVLNQLDPGITQEIMEDSNFSKAWGASIIVSKKKRNNFNITPSVSGYPFFTVAKRSYFDNFLVSKLNPAYAHFMQQTKVKTMKRVDDKWIIAAEKNAEDLEIHADVVVGADGDHSAVLRSLGERKINRQHYAGALRQYWKGINGIHPHNNLEIYLPKSLPLAYLWIFPLPNGEANVGCGLASHIIAKRSIDLKKLFNQLITEDPAIAHRFANATPLEKPVGWGLPLASQPRNVYGDGYLLTGDAASLVCPTTGEGIGPGMLSGYIAATYLERAVKQNRFNKSMFVNYDREIYKRLQSDVTMYNLLRKVSPMLYNWMLNGLSITGFGQVYFNNNSSKWVKTAQKPIEVNM